MATNARPNPTKRAHERERDPAVTILAIVVLAFASLAGAQQSIEITPANHRTTVQPGQGVDGVILVRNPADAPAPVHVQLADFVLQPNGAIRPLPIGSLPSSAAAWTTLSDEELRIGPRGETELRYRVDVPSDAEDGTYWSTIVFRSDATEDPELDQADVDEAPEEGATVRFVAQVGYVLYVDVGTPTRDVRIASIRTLDDRRIAVEVQNTGNGYVRLDGRVELLDLEGDPVATLDFPAAASLPGGVSTLTAAVPESAGSGPFLAAVVVDGADDIVAGQAQVEFR